MGSRLLPAMREFAYLFERFPSFTQTFCYREVAEMHRQGCMAPVFSVRRPPEIPRDCPADLAAVVNYLPEPELLGREMKTLRMVGRYPWPVVWQIRSWGRRPGKARLLEAAWLGARLRRQGIPHVHAHFAGIAARTALWMKRFYGLTFSFTGHANDMFCENDSAVSLEELVEEAQFVVTVSDFSRDWLCRRVGGREGKIHRIYNGMDVESFARAVAPKGRPKIVSVGRYIEKKGFADLIAACALLRQAGTDFECFIIGGGPLEEALREQVPSLGLEDHVRLTGPLPQEEVREVLSSATLFVLACATEADGGMDTLPTVIVEAMAAGLPVVSTRLAAIPEMVLHGETGLLVGEKDPPALAEAISSILSDPQLAKSFSERGLGLVRAKFSSEPTVRSLRTLLTKTACE